MPRTARPTISIPASERRNVTTPKLQPPAVLPRDRSGASGVARPAVRNGQYSTSPSPPRAGQRDAFHQPVNNLYDMLNQAEQLRFSLQDLLHRYEGAYAGQINAMGDFKKTAAQAGTLLGNLQASADSLKEMVRYEVGRSGSAEKREIEELRERVRSLEERLDPNKTTTASAA